MALSGLLGSHSSGASVLDASAAPMPAWVAQAQRRQAGAAPGQDVPAITLSARAGIAVAAAQDVAMVAGENLHLSSGGDSNWSTGAAARLHAGQAIGLVAGAMQPGDEAAGTGLTLAAGAGDVEFQAQDGPLQVAALRDVSFQTVHGGIDLAAVKRIVISTADGAAVVLENGDVELIAPGTFTVRAGKRSFVGAGSYSYAMPVFPRAALKFNGVFPFSV